MPDPLDLDVWLNAITSDLATVTGVTSCRCDGVLDELHEGALVLVDPQSYEPLDDMGEVGWHVEVVVEVLILVPRSTRAARRAALRQATLVAQRCRSATWGVACAPARVTTLYRDDSEPFGRGWEVVRIELAQAVVWRDATAVVEPVPDTVWLGRAPDIGTGHEDDYGQLLPEAP